MLAAAPSSSLAAQANNQEFFLQTGNTLDTDFVLTNGSKVVLVDKNDELFKMLNAPRGWAQKLRYATGFPLEIVNGGTATKNDIALSKVVVSESDLAYQTLNKQFLEAKVKTGFASYKPVQTNIQREGYWFSASHDGLKIVYIQAMGGLRGFQTATLMAMSDGKAVGAHTTIKGVQGTDYPQYENRRIMLDVARKFIPVDQLIGYMDKMSMHKLNELHLHLNDSTSTTVGGAPSEGYFRLYNEAKPRRLLIPSEQMFNTIADGIIELTGDKKVYDSKDWARLEDAAYRYGIKLIPEFDAPGHAGAFMKDGKNILIYSLPPYPTDDTYSDNILANDMYNIWGGNLTSADPANFPNNKTNTVRYFAELIGEFRDWFKSDTIHIWRR
ncbi:family 20 glycosylhydrolase [Phyllobacterium zundukense]|nr:family 20 glycosylhydrolase [Phyllobacterium zundukense]